MDCFAPYKNEGKKAKTQPWLNEQTQALKWECRRAVRRGRKTG